MRRALILILLLLGMQLIQPLGRLTPSAAALLTFGFLILAAYTVGEIGMQARLPKLVGYLIAGIVFGPQLLDVVRSSSVAQLRPVSDLAVALIAFMAGAELQWQQVKDFGGKYFKVVLVEMTLTFVALFATVYLLRDWIPAIAHADNIRVVVFGLLFCSVAIAHSPAVAIGVLSETKAQGPLARTGLGVVLLSDIMLIIVFTVMAMISRALLPPPGAVEMPSLPMVVWEIGGAVIVGAAIGLGVAAYLRFVSRELLLFGIIVAMFGAELARLAHVELLLTLLTAGFVTENVSREKRGEHLRDAVERAASPLFVVFFALAGASIAVNELFAMVKVVIPLALVRGASIWVGSKLGTRWAGFEPTERRYLWASLIAQAGVAIGLATLVADVYPQLGHAVRTMLLALIPVNELLGPILFKRALTAANEIAPPATP